MHPKKLVHFKIRLLRSWRFFFQNLVAFLSDRTPAAGISVPGPVVPIPLAWLIVGQQKSSLHSDPHSFQCSCGPHCPCGHSSAGRHFEFPYQGFTDRINQTDSEVWTNGPVIRSCVINISCISIFTSTFHNSTAVWWWWCLTDKFALSGTSWALHSANFFWFGTGAKTDLALVVTCQF